MGESGVGKSTLFNLIAGLDEPDAGSVVLDGVTVTALDDAERTLLRRRRIGFVFQAFHLLPHLTVAQNVALPLALNGVARRRACGAGRSHARGGRPRGRRGELSARAFGRGDAAGGNRPRAGPPAAAAARGRADRATSTRTRQRRCSPCCASRSSAKAVPACSSRIRRSRPRPPTACFFSRPTV